jgi:hypothetical protein
MGFFDKAGEFMQQMKPTNRIDQLGMLMSTGDGSYNLQGNLNQNIQNATSIGDSNNTTAISGSEPQQVNQGIVGGASNMVGSIVEGAGEYDKGVDQTTAGLHGEGVGSQEQQQASFGGTAKDTLGGLASGASAGSAFGPVGAAIGAGIGGVGGLFKGLFS